jgi:serine/threonine protein kinase
VRKNPLPLEQVYKFGTLLGEGSFGKVYSVTHRVSGEARVCKKIPKVKGEMEMDDILTEIQSMAQLDHPNVIKVYEYFEDKEFVSQIMEPCSGGEVQDTIDNCFTHGGPFYGEAFIRDVMKQTLRALAFMHSENFCHKDLKPQNIMLADKASNSIKVIDFGLAELFQKDQKVSSDGAGTLLYMAPEVFERNFNFKVDVWSTGVILYNLITGEHPFLATWPLPPGKDMEWWQNEVCRKVCEDAYTPHRRLIDGTVSRECIDLLDKMLLKDAKLRPDAAKCLEHPFFVKHADPPPPLSVGVTQCLDAYAGQSELKKAIFLLIAHQCTTPVVQELRAMFTHFDTNNRGTLSLVSLREVLLMSGMSQLSVARAVHSLDKNSDDMVEWTEFLAAVLCISVCKNEPLIKAAFQTIDTDGDGKISVEDIESVFAVGSVKAAWKKLLPVQCADIAPTGPYDLQQFRQYMGQPMRVTPGDQLSAVD